MRRLALPILLTLLAVSGCNPTPMSVSNTSVIETGGTDNMAVGGNAAVDTAPIACPAIGGKLAAPAQCDEYTRQANALTDGVAAFDPPRKMRMGAPETITLVIGQAADAGAVTNAVVGDSGDTNMVRTEKISIGENVSAELTSPNAMFKIAPEGRVVKAMPARGQQIWQWSVEALVPGKHKLTLTVGVPIMGSGGEVWQPVLEPRTFEIDVQARQRTWPEYFDDMAKFFTSLKGALLALAAVVGAVGAIWLALKKLRGGQEAGNEENSGKDGEGG
ncbi:hypothetical protein HZY97_03995 [Sphingomonas sp. R-74633]|uniref:hypothetical protein n=1 Tax=Sphingomonas sp. R-74633 TaxID=2751188 RepID=UPI0015D41F1D|nr:hypothetical protein [Sphingomonas sp. R-74633]NYT39905.1 hypothetical protein [Sphingomonas sp. R-74633]